MTLLRLVLLLVLTLSLNVTGFGAAWARGQAPAVGEIEICRGLTVLSVHVDSEGRPTSEPHLCPDAVHALFGMGFDTPPADLRAIVLQQSRLVPARFVLPGWDAAAVRARGPPLSF